MYKVLSVVNNVADIVSTDGNLNDLPTNYEIGSGGSYTDPSSGELHIYKLTSTDGKKKKKKWIEI